MSIATRDELLGLKKRRQERVELPELGNGHYVNVVGFTLKERTEFELSMQGDRGKPSKSKHQQIRERLIVATCRDDEGNPIFTEDDIGSLGDGDVTVLSRIADAALRVTGFSDADVEELAGN